MRTTFLSGSRARRLLALPLLFAALALVSACGKKTSGQDYTVRGLVRQLPADGRDFTLEHEAIPAFVGRDGEASGMMSMTMPFELEKGVSLDGVEVGDPVEIQLHVDWSADLAVVVTALRELPAGTKLDLPAAEPAGT
jgi:Cu/Ag efflux protein CusF